MKIKITKIYSHNTILLLDKQRFYGKHCDKTKFLNIIHNIDFKKLNKYSKKAINTFFNFEKCIVNAFEYKLSNDLVEVTNNIIKQVKHNAYGYSKFSHLKTRIMIIKVLCNPLKA